MELEVLLLSPTNIYQISTRTSTIKFQASTPQWSLLLCGFDEIEASNDKFNQQLVEDHISHCVQTPECLFWNGNLPGAAIAVGLSRNKIHEMCIKKQTLKQLFASKCIFIARTLLSFHYERCRGSELQNNQQRLRLTLKWSFCDRQIDSCKAKAGYETLMTQLITC